MATIVDGKKRIPFMRGMLVHHLIQRGFDHDEAYGIADEVRTEVRRRKEVERGQILDLIAGLLKRDHPDRPLGNLLFWEPAPTTITVDRDAGPRPFSRELLSHSIQAAGLSPGRSYELARTVEERLLDSGASRIDHGELENLVEEVILDRCDESSAERYRTWRAWGDLNQPLVILIGGATGVGKTTLAVSLANVLDIPRVVATDDIRQILRLTLAQDSMPSIHHSSYDAEAADLQDGLDPVVAAFHEQSRVVGVGVRAIMSRCIEENASVIIDGVHLLPGFSRWRAFEENAIIVPICLALTDRQAYETRFAKREIQAPARSPRKSLSNLDRILSIQEHILKGCDDEDIPVIEMTAVEDPTQAAVLAVVERLRRVEEIRQRIGANGKADGKKAKKKKR